MKAVNVVYLSLLPPDEKNKIELDK
ncbi:DUF3283 family protein, partial [Vibrio sp. V41_P2S12T139]|nr:DUF3283 family protein [Vibrio sp. V41_P2S12T139]